MALHDARRTTLCQLLLPNHHVRALLPNLRAALAVVAEPQDILARGYVRDPQPIVDGDVVDPLPRAQPLLQPELARRRDGGEWVNARRRKREPVLLYGEVGGAARAGNI